MKTPRPPLLDPESSFRRDTLLVLLGCVTMSSLISLILTPLFTFDAFDVVGLVLIVMKSAALFVWLWRRPRAFRAVGLTELTFEVTGGVTKFASLVLIDGFSYGVSGYVLWLPLMYVVAALVLPGRAALTFSLVFYAVFLALGGVAVVGNAVPRRAWETFGNALVQTYVLHATVIAFLAMLGKLRYAYVHAVSRAEQHARLAHVDVLTGLPNRRQLSVWLDEALAASEERAEPLSILTFDLDHFKHVNDTYGHDVGDEVLRWTAGIAASVTRPDDRFGRWGGEEFLMILRNCDVACAQKVAQRLQAAVASRPHAVAGRVTVSCGVTQAQPAESVRAMLRRADDALYLAKREGRNCVRASV